MNHQILHEYIIRKNKHTQMVGFLWAMAITCLVVICVNLYIGESQLPSGFKGTNIYFFLGMIAFAVPGFYIHFAKKMKLLIYRSGRQLCVEIEDPEAMEPLIIKSPFTMGKQWTHVDTGSRNIKMKQMNLTFIDSNGEAVFTIIGNKGAIHDAPYGWDYVDVLKRDEQTPYYMSKNKFTSGKFEEIYIDVDVELRNLNKQQGKEIE